MKHSLNLLLLFCILVSSCSADTEPETPPEEDPKVNLQVSTPQITVDQTITINVNADQPLTQISRLQENVIHSWAAFEGEALPVPFDIFFRFPSPGSQAVTLEFTFANNAVVTRELQFEVKRGNSVQITGVEVNSFENMNGSWDPEYEETDPERLADVEFRLEKLFLSKMTSEISTPGYWYTSEVKQNQGDLSWNLSEAELFLDPEMPFFFVMGDRDENNMGQDLTMWPHKIFLKDYISTRPESISLVDAATNLDVRFYLNWP